MEKIIYTCLTTLLLTFSGFAQTDYDEGMQKALNLLEQEQKSEALLLFEELAKAEEEKWLPNYYSSLILVTEAFPMQDSLKKEKQLDKAQQYLNKAMVTGGKENVENMVLQALVHTGVITLDPEKYGADLYPLVTSIYSKATEMEPGNPRVALSFAEWKMRAAPYMGVDPKIYCNDLKAALKLFDTYVSEEAFAPSWGDKRGRSILVEVCE